MRAYRSLSVLFALVTLLCVPGCKCPSFLNKNCSVDVALAIDGLAADVNRGQALQVTVVLAREGDDLDDVPSNRAWFQERMRTEFTSNRPFDLKVNEGTIRVVQDAGSSNATYVESEDGKSIDLTFSSLGNPEDGGFSRVFVFSDYSSLLDQKPISIDYAQLSAQGWKAQFKLQGDQVVSFTEAP